MEQENLYIQYKIDALRAKLTALAPPETGRRARRSPPSAGFFHEEVRNCINGTNYLDDVHDNLD